MKKILIVLALLTGNVAFAANENDDDNYVLDVKEDTTDVVTIKSIVKAQQEVGRRKSDTEHQQKVWKHRTFFNIAFNKSVSMDPVKTIVKEGDKPQYVPITDLSDPAASDYSNNGKAPKYEADWGVALQNGRNIRLHKKPIGKVATINIDYTWIDLSVNHYKEISDENKKIIDTKSYGEMVDPGIEGYEPQQKELFYTPFNAEKYEANFGMSVGPSLTLAPFTYVKPRGLHFLKFNGYFHVGYNVSVLMMRPNIKSKADDTDVVSEVFNSLLLDFGHGLYTAWGINMSWKSIGLGFERRKGHYDYKPLISDAFMNDKYRFNSETTRFYLQFRF